MTMASGDKRLRLVTRTSLSPVRLLHGKLS
jgi:hypothetical protein